MIEKTRQEIKDLEKRYEEIGRPIEKVKEEIGKDMKEKRFVFLDNWHSLRVEICDEGIVFFKNKQDMGSIGGQVVVINDDTMRSLLPLLNELYKK